MRWNATARDIVVTASTRGGRMLGAFSLITPANFGSGGGSCWPPIVVVAPGEPGSPVGCKRDA
jgi:hypothetical protein